MKMPEISPISIHLKGSTWLKRTINWLSSTRKWVVKKDYYIKHPFKHDTQILIPKGFIFNGASIPKVFWIFYNPVGILFIPSLPHDYVYQYHKILLLQDGDIINTPCDRKEIDLIFRAIAIEINRLHIASGLAYYILRLFGRVAWKA